tara:strand:+ start:661 stop:1077 length:417 start_codon:yes stop_codon:yes gene_type:complete
MKKKEDWIDIFFEFIRENKDKPFEWGKWDCCIFANACIKAMTGQNLIPNTLKWKNEETAMKAIKDYGKTLKGAVTKACKTKKLQEVKPAFITTGDLVVFKEDSELVGISDGFNILAPSEDGIAFKSHDLIVKGWRING